MIFASQRAAHAQTIARRDDTVADADTACPRIDARALRQNGLSVIGKRQAQDTPSFL
jgi:hypothetical protein